MPAALVHLFSSKRRKKGVSSGQTAAAHAERHNIVNKVAAAKAAGSEWLARWQSWQSTADEQRRTDAKSTQPLSLAVERDSPFQSCQHQAAWLQQHSKIRWVQQAGNAWVFSVSKSGELWTHPCACSTLQLHASTPRPLGLQLLRPEYTQHSLSVTCCEMALFPGPP